MHAPPSSPHPSFLAAIHSHQQQKYTLKKIILFPGKFVFKNELLHTQVKASKLAALHYVDDAGNPTDMYPLNPNGSPGGLAGLCSEDGRHLAIMPHPERCVLPWQCPWMPGEMRGRLQFSPWIRMFQNAYDWCVGGGRS